MLSFMLYMFMISGNLDEIKRVKDFLDSIPKVLMYILVTDFNFNVNVCIRTFSPSVRIVVRRTQGLSCTWNPS